MTDEPLVSQEEMASVLSTDAESSAPEARDSGAGAPGGSTAYSLRKPVAIAPENEAAAKSRVERLAGGLQQVLCRGLEAEELTLRVQGFQQEQAGAAVTTLPQPAWILSFLHEDGGGIGLALDPTCALAVVEMALGGAGKTSTGGRAPTPLETRVLDKLCTSLVGSLSRETGERFVGGLFAQEQVPSRLAAPGQTVGVGLLELHIAETDRNALILVTAGLLRERDDTEQKKETLHVGPLAAALDRVKVEMRPVLEAGTISFSDLIEMRPGTVLMLEAEETRPLQLRVEGQPVFLGTVEPGDCGSAIRVDRRRGRRTAAGGAQESGKSEETS